MFRVVPDQLKISDGWVRCGHCSDVFDATLNLQSETPSAETSPPSQSTSPTDPTLSASRIVVRRVPVHQAAPPAPPPAPPSPAPYTPVFVRRSAEVPAPTPAPAPVPPPMPAIFQEPVVPFAANPSDDPGWGFASQFEEPDEALGPESEVDDTWDGEWLLSPNVMSQHRDAVQKEMQSQAVPAVWSRGNDKKRAVDEDFTRELAQFSASGLQDEHGEDAEAPEAPEADGDGSDIAPPSRPQASMPREDPDSGFDPVEHEPTFVVQGRRDAFWRSPAMRAGLLMLAVVLSGVLALQWAVHERDQLAARHPFLVPVLQTLCEASGCSLAAPRHIEAVAIDSSTLVRKLGQFYAFDLVVKNSDPVAVAMPALELSLTDGRDKEIARRVFLPEEMPGTPTLVPAHGSLSVSMRLALSESELSTMAGYRALVFYP
jgi:predicted Zn finger-like uncharacterized protein